MPSNYPAGFDSLNNPISTDPLDSATVPHADQHADINDAVEALQQAVGLNPQGTAASLTARVTDAENFISSVQGALAGLDGSVESARQDAEQSAAEASGFAVDAGVARDAAVAAQGGAETARDAAIAAETTALGHVSDAETHAQAAAASESAAFASESNAAASALLAESWASKTDGPVVGGTTSDYSAKYWAQVANPANGITQTIFDAKGDMLVAAGDDQPARLPVGLDGQAIIADSSEPNGVKWGDVAVDAYTKAESDANYDPAGSAAAAQSASQTYTDNALLAFQPTGDSFTSYEFVATAGQTVFSGADANGATLGMTPGLQQVYLNGVLLRPDDDYTATATDVTLLAAANVGDELQVIAWASFEVANAYTKAEADGKFALDSEVVKYNQWGQVEDELFAVQSDAQYTEIRVESHAPTANPGFTAMGGNGGGIQIQADANNAAMIVNRFVGGSYNQTWVYAGDGFWSFSVVPQYSSDPVGDNDLARKAYVDSRVQAGDSFVGGDGIDRIVKLTQAEYDALGTPDATTFYVIVG